MTRHLWTLRATLVFLVIAGARCVQDVRLEVIPEKVERGQEAILRCHYDLKQAPLYSFKVYRGKFEFYRVSPTEEPPTKTFNFTGMHVDLARSNMSQVTLRNVDFGIAGRFTCEVTADAPTFSTGEASKNLTVVSLPKGKPVIVSERECYDPGDTLRATCSLPPSRPSANLTFTLNNVPLQTTTKEPYQHQYYQIQQYIQQQKRDHNEGALYNELGSLQWSEVSLLIQPFHYLNGQLNLRCTAQIYDIYTSTSEIQLGAGLREPVPERVTSENGCECQTFASLTILCSGVLHLLLR